MDRILVLGRQSLPRFSPILKVVAYLAKFGIRPIYIDDQFSTVFADVLKCADSASKSMISKP